MGRKSKSEKAKKRKSKSKKAKAKKQKRKSKSEKAKVKKQKRKSKSEKAKAKKRKSEKAKAKKQKRKGKSEKAKAKKQNRKGTSEKAKATKQKRKSKSEKAKAKKQSQTKMSTASKMLSLAAFVFLSGRADGLKAGIDYAVVRSGETYSSFRGPGNNPERVCDPVRVVCPECKSNVRLHKGSSCHSVEWDHKEGCKRTTISKKAAAAARAAAAPPTAPPTVPTPETNADPLKNIISTTQGETEGEAREQEHMEQEGGRRLERSLFTALVRYLLRIFFRLPVRLLVYCSALSKTLFWCLVAVAVGFTVLFFLFMLGYYGKTFEKERNQPINGVLPTLLAIGLAVGWLDFANVATKWKAAGKELSQAEAHADMNSVEMVEFVSGLMGEDKVPKFGSFLIFAYGCIAKGFRYVVFLAAFQQTANSVAWFLYEEIAIIAG